MTENQTNSPSEFDDGRGCHDGDKKRGDPWKRRKMHTTGDSEAVMAGGDSSAKISAESCNDEPAGGRAVDRSGRKDDKKSQEIERSSGAKCGQDVPRRIAAKGRRELHNLENSDNRWERKNGNGGDKSGGYERRDDVVDGMANGRSSVENTTANDEGKWDDNRSDILQKECDREPPRKDRLRDWGDMEGRRVHLAPYNGHGVGYPDDGYNYDSIRGWNRREFDGRHPLHSDGGLAYGRRYCAEVPMGYPAREDMRGMRQMHPHPMCDREPIHGGRGDPGVDYRKGVWPPVRGYGGREFYPYGWSDNAARASYDGGDMRRMYDAEWNSRRVRDYGEMMDASRRRSFEDGRGGVCFDPYWQDGRYYADRRRFQYNLGKSRKRIPVNPPPSKILGIFGLSNYATVDDLKDLLTEKMHDIKYNHVHLVKDRNTGQSRGFGFVYFNSVDDSIRAKEILEGQELYGKPIRVDYSISGVGLDREGK